MSKSSITSACAILLLIAMLLVSCEKKNPDMYEISGKLENVAGDCFYMSHEKGDSIIIDTIPIDAKGEFSVKGKVDTLTVMSLYFNQNARSTFVLVDKGWDVQMKGDILFSDLVDVKGGSVNEDLTDFKNKNKDLLKSRADLLNSAEERIGENDSIVLKDYVGDLKNINFELSNVAAAYIQNHPDKIASVMLLNLFFRDETSIPRLDENLKLLKGRAADFSMTQELRTFTNKVKMSAPGSVAPYFALKDLRGKEVRITEFKGKYVLLTFASTTCRVCREEKVDAVAVYNQLKKEKSNIEFITIVKDIEQVPISNNITDSVKWHILPVEGGWSAKPFDNYYVREMPYNILISPTGYVLERNIHILALPQKMEELTKGVGK